MLWGAANQSGIRVHTSWVEKMGVQVTASTIPGGFTPTCSNCGVALCWDISDEEYQSAKEFWDAWICRHCNGGEPLSLKAWKGQQTTSFMTTAIYPNRIEDKRKVESQLHLAEQGNEDIEFFTRKGNLFAKGYVRIVYGDHGPYVEFEQRQIIIGLQSKFPNPPPTTAYYEWLQPTDGSGVKVYDQKRDVKKVPFAPKGGHREFRAEGYADYQPGMIYVNPFELKTGKSTHTDPPHPKVKVDILRNQGHPWDGRPGWDRLNLKANNDPPS